MSKIKSPSSLMVVGTRKWTMMNNSIKAIITDKTNWIHLIISFYRNEEILPNIALTTFPAKELFWELAVQEDKSQRAECFLPHQWSEKDAEYWENRKYSNGESVVLSMHCDPLEPGKIKIVFEHKNTVSNVYKFPLCAVERDAFLLFLAPLSKFRKMKNQCNPLSILTTAEFMKEIHGRISQGRLQEKQSPKTNISCIVGCERKAEIVFIHCGHCVFCSKCIGSYKEKKCPICSKPFVEDELICISKDIRQPTKCLVCPPKINCQEMNSMMLPCSCIIGCHKYSQRAISPGDLCINCNETVQNLVKVYVKE